jgi:hypothetical protein
LRFPTAAIDSYVDRALVAVAWLFANRLVADGYRRRRIVDHAGAYFTSIRRSQRDLTDIIDLILNEVEAESVDPESLHALFERLATARTRAWVEESTTLTVALHGTMTLEERRRAREHLRVLLSNL